MELITYMETFNIEPSKLAEASGVTVQAISQYKLRKRTPRKDIAFRIVAATKGQVSLSDLYSPPNTSDATGT